MNKTRIKDIPIMERPRERLIKYGVKNLSNEELISIILKTGSKKENVKILSNNILKTINGIDELKYKTISSLKEIDGIGEVKAVTLLASIELGKRVYEDKIVKKVLLNTSKSVYEFLKNDLKNQKQEFFFAIYLDNKLFLIEKKLLFIGTVNRSVVHPREIFKYAYLLSASSIICVHNHPSGDTLPSKEDILFTNNIKKIGEIQGINVIDHIIIGNNNYYSIFENNI